MYYLYILINIDKTKTYTGITDNLERRINEHNSGKSKFTSRHKPWNMLYNENLLNREEARKREKYFKSSVGRKKIKLMIEN